MDRMGATELDAGRATQHLLLTEHMCLPSAQQKQSDNEADSVMPDCHDCAFLSDRRFGSVPISRNSTIFNLIDSRTFSFQVNEIRSQRMPHPLSGV